MLVFNILGNSLRNKIKLWTFSPGIKMYIQWKFSYNSGSSWTSPSQQSTPTALIGPYLPFSDKHQVFEESFPLSVPLSSLPPT